ncbi:uncharacterized protein LOC126903928 [Daktulosphaira vitifoliae]|uniref:uncharacterized protein LOC126903928 n=1 Tax=Daktulosphaira vitifoliae TaxID=58002 RepID=UPI0021A9874A|nr:uncharacterized protein LOC126903928 [Daktulosphaira vitifoliae]
MSVRHTYTLDTAAVKEKKDVGQFLMMAADIDALWEAFLVENEAVLDAMIELNELDKFKPELEPEIRALVRSVSAMRAEVEQDGMAVRSNSNGIQEGIQNTVVPSIAFPQASTLSNGVIRDPKLPTIPLPRFGGKLDEWSAFSGRFESQVVQHNELNNEEKYFYLMGCLYGEAEEITKGYHLSTNSFTLAWAALEDRYNKPRQLANSLVERLLNMTRVGQETVVHLNEFLKVFEDSIALLHTLPIPDVGDFVLFTLGMRCLPIGCRKVFESECGGSFPSVEDLITFVKERARILENVGIQSADNKTTDNKYKYGKFNYNKQSFTSKTALIARQTGTKVNNLVKCYVCDAHHNLPDCDKFKSLTVAERFSIVKAHRLCFICLSSQHLALKCKAAKCNKCSFRHHSLLHRLATEVPSQADNSPATLMGSLPHTMVVLGTALAHARDCWGNSQIVRVLIDSASQISIITAGCVERLGLSRTRWTAPISGLSGVNVPGIDGVAHCTLTPRHADEPKLQFKAWILPKITGEMPHGPLTPDIQNKYSHLALADPQFYKPGPVDMLIGADLFPAVMDGKRVVVNERMPTAFGSVFGWVLIGEDRSTITPADQQLSMVSCFHVSLEQLMGRFWAIEEPEEAPMQFTDEGHCEDIFQNEVDRAEDGRFIVPLPLRNGYSPELFADSKQIAIKRFLQLENKLSRDKMLAEHYQAFMQEYEALNHMSVAKEPGVYFIPHHGVCKMVEDKLKLRVVFDGSARGVSGKSLNDLLYPGPKLQQDVVDVLIGFRSYRVVFTADICKMYRQFWIHKKYRPLQHILWRSSPKEELKEYELNTVTYGLNCAPYLALRVLKEIAMEVQDEEPDISRALQSSTYMDDICTGAQTLEEAKRLRDALVHVLAKSGLELKKWSSNYKEVLAGIPVEDQSDMLDIAVSDGGGVKVLGMRWLPSNDEFKYDIILGERVMTKRSLLSTIARLFDPLGLVAPVIFYAKSIMQEVWKYDLQWDSSLPSSIMERWTMFLDELEDLKTIRIPRVICSPSPKQVTLCGFCDASTKGYAALVYLHSVDDTGNINVRLIGSKTKLSPMKPTTVPRLELCAAVLLSKWLSRIHKLLSSHMNIDTLYAWSDSTVVLSWINLPQVSFKIFVSNRVKQIRDLLPNCEWRYVPTSINPADCASRGVLPSKLKSSVLYWNGPDFLKNEPRVWPSSIPVMSASELPEVKTNAVTLAIVENSEVEWFHRFSSYTRLIRVGVLLRRFMSKSRGRTSASNSWPQNELTASLYAIVMHTQKISFSALKLELEGGRRVSSRLYARLAPFIDSLGLIRVGGRIKHASLDTNQKHPLLLSSQSHLALLLFRYWHIVGCHSGPKFMMNMVARQFWIISARKVARRVIKECVKCVRFAAVNPQPMMAQLPAVRVQASRPFSNVGIDYAGAFAMKEQRLRKSREYKVYVAVFVCMTTKAVHLEVVSDLSTPAFLATLDRFVSRRGLPSQIYTDCGTNFVGADRMLQIKH